MKRFVLLPFALGGAAAWATISVLEMMTIPSSMRRPSTLAAIDATPVDASPGRGAGPVHRHHQVVEAALSAPRRLPSTPWSRAACSLALRSPTRPLPSSRSSTRDPVELTGCKVTELTVAQLAAAGIDEGPVQFTVNNGGAPANPTFPACVFVPAGTGYICPDTSSSQALTAVNSVSLEQINTTTSRLTVVGGSGHVCRRGRRPLRKFSGTGTAFDASYAALPIVALGATSNVVVLGSPIPLAAIPLTAGMMTTLAASVRSPASPRRASSRTRGQPPPS